MKKFLFMLAGTALLMTGCGGGNSGSGPQASTTEISGPLGKAFVLANKNAKVVKLDDGDYYLEVVLKLKDASKLPEGYSRGSVGCVDDKYEDGIASIAGFGLSYIFADGEMDSYPADDDLAYYSEKEIRDVLRLQEGKTATLHLYLPDVIDENDVVESFSLSSYYLYIGDDDDDNVLNELKNLKELKEFKDGLNELENAVDGIVNNKDLKELENAVEDIVNLFN